MLKRPVRTKRGATPVRAKMIVFFVQKSVAPLLVRTPISQNSCFYHIFDQIPFLVRTPFFSKNTFIDSSDSF